MFLKNFQFRFVLKNLLLTVFVFCLLSDCRSDSQTAPNVKIVELKDFETFVAIEDNTLAVPSIIRYTDSTLFIFDKGKGTVLALDSKGDIVKKYGRKGRGPGEFLRVNNIFLTKDNLYIVDTGQYLIHKYERNGDAVSSFDYGKIVGLGRPNTPPTPFSPSSLYAKNINNQPFVTLQENVLISSSRFSQTAPAIYELRDWEGNFISNIGKIPEGSSLVIDYEQLQSAVSNRKIPAFYRSNVFPVSDPANPKEFFLIYTAFPKIAKYNSKGQQLWEKRITGVPEIDSITTHFFETMEYMLQRSIRSRMILSYYTSGISSPEGNLYLITDSSPPWIHQFDTTGELIRRYKLVSENVDLLPIFDIDFTGLRIFGVTEEGEIRTYRFGKE